MMRLRLWLLVLSLMLSPISLQPVQAQNTVTVLNYHDIGPIRSALSVDPSRLRQHFEIIRQAGYQVISLQDYEQMCAGRKVWPEKGLILTFDDGYSDFIQHVVPLLREYGYTATIAAVSNWENVGAPHDIGSILSWQQLKDLEATGMVTVISHSHNLHHFISSNNWGDQSQAASCLIYEGQQYETLPDYELRIQNDLRQNVRQFEKNLNHKPLAIAWPYGEFTIPAEKAARDSGLAFTLTLGSGINLPPFSSRLTRAIIYGNPDEKQFRQLLLQGSTQQGNIRLAQVDIDAFYDPDPAKFNQNVDALIDRLNHEHINLVALQSFSDPSGSGNIEALYFYNTLVPVKADVFSHVAAKLNQAGMDVYAWLPTLALQPLISSDAEELVTAQPPNRIGWYRRATPFSTRITEKLSQLCRELGAYSPTIKGILFQDDLYLNDFEDYSPAAQAVFRQTFGQEMSPQALADPNIRSRWGRIKAEKLLELTDRLTAEIRLYRPEIKSARNIYTAPVLDPKAQEWLAQNLQDYLKHYDYTVIMAYPYLEKTSDPELWLTALAKAASQQPDARRKIIFKLQAYDWNQEKWLSPKVLQRQFQTLQAAGAAHLGYYPEPLTQPDYIIIPPEI